MALTIPVAELNAEVSATLTRLAERGYTADQAAHTVGSGTLLVHSPEGEFTFVHQSVMEWLVADAAAGQLRSGEVASALHTRTISKLMLDFLCDLAGHEVAGRWADDVLADAAATRGGETERTGRSRPPRLGPHEPGSSERESPAGEPARHAAHPIPSSPGQTCAAPT